MVATTELKKIAEGREAEIFEWEPGSVLRLFRNARGAESIEYERAAMEAVRAFVPLVPAVLGVTEVMGRSGIIMERVDGPDLLSIVAKKPWMVWRAGQIAGEVHTQLQRVQAPPTIPSLRELGQRLLPESPLVPPHIAAWALRELDALPDGDGLLHGDFHPGNILMSAHGPVVIDWPGVMRGNPDADLGRSLLLLRLGELPPGSPLILRLGARVARSVLRASYVRAYRRTRDVDMGIVLRWERLRAADRLMDDIPEERAALLAIIEAAMAAR